MCKLSLLACCCVPVTIFSPLRLHAGENNEIQTPFGEILENEDIKDKDGSLFGSCSWKRHQVPIWRSASDAVVWRNGDNLVRFAVNKSLVQSNESDSTLDKTIFWKAELPTLARYPPKKGFRVLNEHHHVRCCHLMPFIRWQIEQNGLLSEWQKVDTFSCIDVAQVRQPYDPQNLDREATEFLKPGKPISKECNISSKSLTKNYNECRARGEIDLEFFHKVAGQFPPEYMPHIGKLRLPQLWKKHGLWEKHRPALVLMMPDIVRMFDTNIVLEICLVQFTKERANKVYVFVSMPINELDIMLIALSCS